MQDTIAEIAQDIVEMTEPRVIRGITVTKGNLGRDPLNVSVRTYIQVHEVLNSLEIDDNITLRERIAALAMIERLRPKEDIPDDLSGSSVRKYETAFAIAKDGAGRRKKVARPPTTKPESGRDWFDDDGVKGSPDDE